MKIKLIPSSTETWPTPYSATLDTEVMRVEITEAFIGPVISNGLFNISICARDDGFEIAMWELGSETMTYITLDRTCLDEVNGTTR